MLERNEAYKKLVDQEKEAAINQMTKKLGEEKNKSAESSFRQLTQLNEELTNLADLLARLIPFVPPEDRFKLFVDTTNLEPQVNDRLFRLAEGAPDFSRPETRRGLGYAGYFIKERSKKSD